MLAAAARGDYRAVKKLYRHLNEVCVRVRVIVV